MKKKIRKTSKVRILHILKTFTQVISRLKNFLVGWLLILGLKEGLVECATVLGHTNRQQHQCQCQNADLAPIHIHTTKKHTTYIILPLIPFGKLLETFSFGKLETFF